MKISLVLFTIALMTSAITGVRYGLTGSINSAKSGYEIFLTMMAEIKTNVESYIKDTPDTEAYKKYRESFVNILKKFDDEYLCGGRLRTIYNELTDVIAQLNSDESVEAKNIQEIIMTHRHKDFATKYSYGIYFIEHPHMLEQCEDVNDTINNAQYQHEYSKYLKASRENFMELIASTKVQIELVNKALPETDPKNKYKLEFETLLKRFDEKSQDDLCDRKLVRIYREYMELYEQMHRDRSDEAQTADAVLKEYSIQYIKNQLDLFIKAIPDTENYGKYKQEFQSVSKQFEEETKNTLDYRTIKLVLYKFDKESEEVKNLLELAKEYFKSEYERYKYGKEYMENVVYWELKFC